MDIFETLIKHINDELEYINDKKADINKHSLEYGNNLVAQFVCAEERQFYTDLRGKLADLAHKLEFTRDIENDMPLDEFREKLAVKTAERELAKEQAKPNDKTLKEHRVVEDDGSVTVHPEIKPALVKPRVEEHNLLPLDHTWGRNEVAAMFPKMGKYARRAINDLYMDKEPDPNDFAVLKDYLRKRGYKPEFKLEKLTKDTPLHLFPDMELMMMEDIRRWFAGGAGLAPGALEHIRYYLKRKGYKL